MKMSLINKAGRVVGSLALMVSGAIAVAGGDQEGDLKSAYVYNFTKYCTFQTPSGRVVVGIYGEEGIVSSLERTLANKTVEGQPLVVKRITDESGLHECSVLFVCGSEASRVSHITSSLRNAPVLTVGDTPNFAQKGVMINMVVEDNHVKFDVNVGYARASKVTISSKLLQLAQNVIGN